MGLKDVCITCLSDQKTSLQRFETSRGQCMRLS
ncbi:Uncharacterised protein [Vibrio cholerae]|nr:Uncharacterised protein [Vibrio cholerae]